MPNVEQVQQSNPLLARTGLPDFAAIEPAHIVPALRETLAEAERRLTLLEEDIEPTWEHTIRRLGAIDHLFEYAWNPVKHLYGVKNTDELRQAYETILGEVVQFRLRIRQSRPLFEEWTAMKEGPVWDTLTDTQKRILDMRLLGAKLGGIGLDDAPRERFNEIAREMSQLAKSFSNNVLDVTKQYALDLHDPADVEGLPPSLLALAAQAYNRAQEEGSNGTEATPEHGPWRITLEVPLYLPFMKHARNRALRERLYRAHTTRASKGDLDNTPLIEQILKLRREQAHLLGYETYAEVSLAQKMADRVEDVEAMFSDLRAASWEPAREEMKALEDLARESGVTYPLQQWDLHFWAERLREKLYDYTDEEIRPYFPFETVLQGLFDVCHRLFGITVRKSEEDISVWHEDVRFFNVYNEADEHIASFYLDPYSRPENKRGGAWMDDCLSRRQLDEGIQLPVAHLVCNSTPPIGDIPSLMTFREVETLFHEFGHGLQHMLTTVNEADASGINGVEWDAVELPSQFMENWCYHKPTLHGMSGHYETNEPLPDDLFEKLKASRTFRAASGMLRQLRFGMIDMYLHHQFDPQNAEKTVFDIQREISEQTSILPILPENRFLCAFQHIFAGAYAAGYYSYKWAEILSADAFGAFEEAGLDDAEAVASVGRRFRDTVLARGGSQDPMDVFEAFMGRPPNAEALLRHSGLLPTS